MRTRTTINSPINPLLQHSITPFLRASWCNSSIPGSDPDGPGANPGEATNGSPKFKGRLPAERSRPAFGGEPSGDGCKQPPGRRGTENVGSCSGRSTFLYLN